ncbi:MAG: hypothetical protein LWX11_02615 [Firmicutes bacterium]|nr:hypothetical protein [Bacillota bacterium]
MKLPIVALLLVGAALHGNDGWDRCRKNVPSTFQLFPQPISAQAGYGILPKDSEGGADGDVRFRWSQPHTQALVRMAARAVARDLGPGPHPLLIMDASAENGDTPVDFLPAPRGRHPGGSHDGGLNLDLGYYLTSLKGKVYTPDYAAATEHFQTRPDGTLRDVPQCLGSADRLDVPRQARFFVELFRVNREAFGGDLLEEIGVDFQVRQPVLAQVRAWSEKGTYGASPALVADMERVLTSDEAEGWAQTHHHHFHLRVRDIPLLGQHRAALEALQTLARREETELRQVSSPVLTVALLSNDLHRSLEAELLPTGIAVKELNFRVDGGPWKHAQPGDARNRAVLELPDRRDAATCLVEAQGTDAAGKAFTLTQTVELPAQDPRLAIAVEASRLQAEVSETTEILKVRPRIPQPYHVWVTETALVLHRQGQAPEKRVLADPTAEITLDRLQPAPLQSVELRVLCSGRRAIQVPIWLK